ncbi:DsbA family oxidoreductase [Tardiphaga sp.]|uniref:DsbA family oxidoreductase n=1 Tax=Tardiphaga sp. TaxID=1926292 RepID=UPI002627A96E|nr:DsbA family oxidoreductase [Tardiphaga sp.]MDB5621317.1 putative dithiol-disulfide isomerase involved in polyketide biosynthesis [Tardiphaga sp.]
MIEIEVWSDIVCPFCYIGKRHLEAALKKSGLAEDQVRVRWKSFELDPQAARDPVSGLSELLAKKYGKSVEWAKQLHDQMREQAKTVGLDYRFDLARPTNTFDAHRLIHLADRHGLQEKAEERLFQAYYTRGEHVGDPETLTRIGAELGLDPKEVKQMLESDALADEVRRDEQEAQEVGVAGVPFFVINRKYAISGAQPVEVFEEVLRNAL